MLSSKLIERHLMTGRFDALLEALFHNGMVMPLSLRIRLSQHPLAVLALGLRRVVELSHGSTPGIRAMTRQLLRGQEADGSFAADPLATASVAAALEKLRREARDAPVAEDPSEIAVAGERAMAALAAMQGDDGLFHAGDDRTEQERALISAFIAFLLAGSEAFRRVVRFADLMSWFEQRRKTLDPHTRRLWSISRLDVWGRLSDRPSRKSSGGRLSGLLSGKSSGGRLESLPHA